ncbi:RNA-metabolising metallo-beta-lactamase domain containing protein [Plasmodium gonderi]|uniref:RNA-metabolising metallo-beta-lactamase domain containing protein n=1 Tax=Plasmodium gonderi TaxID=77519 RepID=A0A1Y1JHE5_PLAGO|nr:RNA-metabolising metallo-beta-lactamase domain containing protein [Plasmodium gonderi]GAW80637.1 RNA-metabolising metallo-beta-lactamase domain containing protein [Plasmodium gonderi]
MNHYNETKIIIQVLGAGQTVGRSCVIVELENRRVMFDCGSHLGYKDERKYPNFNILVGENDYNPLVEEEKKGMEEGNVYEHHLNTEVNISIVNSSISNKEKLINNLKRINEIIDCVIISHFHMDHIGALPFFTEILKYKGTIIMSYPTKALSPILLLDGCRVADIKWEKKNLERQIKMLNEKSDELLNYNISSLKKDPWNINEENIHSCISKVIGLQINETYEMGDMSITPYYAGHVLGACIFKIEVNNFSVIYTGDYNTVPDKHLGSTKIPSLNPEIFISESTYATYVRPTRKASELDLCNMVHECVHKGGKVLIPVFAIGRAQELSILLDTYWKKMKINYPIYFGCGLTENANKYYKIYSSWVSSTCISTDKKNLFDFTNISPFVNTYLSQNRPMVLFATPGMLHTGLSLKAFKAWAGSSQNLIVLPGYCVQGTVGHKLIMGERKISFDGNTYINVACRIIYLSFSAHADSNGIQQLIRHVVPKNVIFVHGEKNSMEKLSKHISTQYLINSFCPSLGQYCEFNFSKGAMDHVYIHHALYEHIIRKLKDKKEGNTLLSNTKTNYTYKGDDFQSSFYDSTFSVSFYSYIIYFSIREKPFLFFFPKRELLKELKERNFSYKICRNNQSFSISNLFSFKSSYSCSDSEENSKFFLKKCSVKKQDIQNCSTSQATCNVNIETVKKNGEDQRMEENMSYSAELCTSSNVGGAYDTQGGETQELSLFDQFVQRGKRKFEDMSRMEGTLEEGEKDPKGCTTDCISKKYSHASMNCLYFPVSEKNMFTQEGSCKVEKSTTGLKPGDDSILFLSEEEENESYIENSNRLQNQSRTEYHKDDSALGRRNNLSNFMSKRNNYVMEEEIITLPLINLRFKENITISYQNFYNFVITFFQEILNMKNKNNIRFLGEKVIIKNVKHHVGYFFLLSFMSLRAIHDGENSLFIQWSYVDDAPGSVIQKFIESIRKYAE